ncbi:hypothetical protein [Bacillus gaemokensis]|nr:hypothetical protein [Bacillus gaemokensis]
MKKFVKAMLLCFVIFAVYPTTNAFAANKYLAGTHGYWESIGTSCQKQIWAFYKYDSNGLYNPIDYGWVQSENEVDWYYIKEHVMFDPSNSCLKNYNGSSWLKIDGRWYLFNPGGKLVKKEGWEWSANAGRWIYWIPGNYGLATNESRVINGVTYYFDSNGYMK